VTPHGDFGRSGSAGMVGAELDVELLEDIMGVEVDV
jgi:hypothetical protein